MLRPGLELGTVKKDRFEPAHALALWLKTCKNVQTYAAESDEAKAYLQKIVDGEIVEENEIRHEVYQAQKGLVIEGVEDVPAGITPIDTGVEIITNNN